MIRGLRLWKTLLRWAFLGGLLFGLLVAFFLPRETVEAPDAPREPRDSSATSVALVQMPTPFPSLMATPSPVPTATPTLTATPTPFSGPLQGVVRDARRGTVLAGAKIIAGKLQTTAGPQGEFSLPSFSRPISLTVLAAGYQREQQAVEGATTIELKLQPFVVRGIYLTFYTLGWEERREELFRLVETTGLNAVVMDVKGDMGLVNAGVGVPLSKAIGAEQRLGDMEEMVRRLKSKGIYAIARIVVFKDTLLAQQRPELAVKDSGRGGIYVDCEQQRWVDPFNRAVWDYNLAIAEQAARLGFDEVQFDYIRFPSDCIMGELLYGQESNAENRMKAIEGFLAAARARLHPLGAFVGADTFGWTTLREDDMGIGQLLERIAPQVDYFSPMVYPSTWGPGSLEMPYPAAQPYEIVFRSLKRGMERLEGIPGVRLRPWLQDYDDYGPRKLSYGVAEVQAQIKAAADASALGWMLWDPWVKYTRGALPARQP